MDCITYVYKVNLCVYNNNTSTIIIILSSASIHPSVATIHPPTHSLTSMDGLADKQWKVKMDGTAT